MDEIDEINLLEDNVNIKLNALETILLSTTVVFSNTLLELLINNDCVFVRKVRTNGEPLPESEQTGVVMVKSSLKAMQQIRQKIYEGGKLSFGGVIPQDLNQVTEVYARMLMSVLEEFLSNFRQE
jgi:hypothetical protein